MGKELGNSMLRIFSVIVLVLAAGLSQAVDIEMISPTVWTALQPDSRKFNDCNSLIVAADDFVIIVDAQENPDDVQQIIQFANTQIGKPVRYLINTHWHSDHTQGNTLYKEFYGDELTIIGHQTHTEDIENRAAAYVRDRVESLKQQLPAARDQLESGIKLDGSKFTPEELELQTVRVQEAETWVLENDGFQFTLPTLVIDDVYSVKAGNESFDIYPMRGHTRGDLVVHFPHLQLIATGDLVDAMPYTGHGFPGEWVNSLGAIKGFDATTYLPGHGPALTDDVLVDNLLIYFRSLTDQVKLLLDAGKSTDQIKADIDLSQSRSLLAGDDEAALRFFDRVQAEAIDRAIVELNGTPK
jgi:glyoxylase-like metal-dependent hydrolase (beta-lactamase superfamily II)